MASSLIYLLQCWFSIAMLVYQKGNIMCLSTSKGFLSQWILYSSGWWFGSFFIFPYIGNVIIPTDEVIFFRGGLNHQPAVFQRDGFRPTRVSPAPLPRGFPKEETWLRLIHTSSGIRGSYFIGFVSNHFIHMYEGPYIIYMCVCACI